MTKSQLLSLIAAHPSKLEAATAIRLVGEVWREPQRVPGMDEVLQACCIATNADYKKVKIKSRKHELKSARQLFYHYFRTRYDGLWSVNQLGDFTRREYTTVIHGTQFIQGLLDVKDPTTIAQMDIIDAVLSGEPYSPYFEPKPDRTTFYVDGKTKRKFTSITDLCNSIDLPYCVSFKTLRKRYGGRFYKQELVG